MVHPPRHAVILAGGPGSRLWPLSRADRPKFVLELLPGRPSSLADTWNRLVPIVGADHIWVVTGTPYVSAVTAELPALATHRLLVEPSSRDSLPALALAVATITATEPDAVIATFPADNHASDGDAFARAVDAAFDAAAGGTTCAIGMVPTAASTAFGYLEVATDDDAADVRRAVAFTEKPGADLAAAYVADGRHLWNGGVYVAAGATFLAEIGRFRPDVHAAVVAEDGTAATDVAAWEALPAVSIDRGLSELVAAAGRLQVVPATFGWEDTGDFAALFDALAADGSAIVDPTSVQLVDASGLVLSTPGRTVSVLGLDDVVVVDTPDAVLVTTLAHAQRVREIVAGWSDRDRSDLL